MGLAAPARKQNSSCDQCRRSKRRCVPAEDEAAASGQCLNCLHLGHRCTFDFVNSRLSQKKNKTKQSFSSHLPHRSITSAAERGNHQFAVLGFSEPTLASSGNTTAQYAVSYNDNFPECDDSNPSIGLQSRWQDPENNSLSQTSRSSAAPRDLTARILDDGHTFKLRWAAPTVPAMPQNSASSALGLWSGSPINLLNSRVEQQYINENLGDVYNSMMSGIAIRYLESKTNLFADGSSKYTFDETDSSVSDTATSASDTKSQMVWPSWKRGLSAENVSRLQPLTPEQLSSHMKNITMVGVARFLDNFAQLYGNVMSRQVRQQHDETLVAVLYAFALQYAPSRDFQHLPTSLEGLRPKNEGQNNNLQFFTTAWFRAHARLVATKQHRSFLRLYAMFMFQMTCMPPHAMSIVSPGETPLELLDDSLRDLQSLQCLVEKYCEDLSSHSVYRFLLHNSVDIIRWFGYLRDTIDALLYERSCVLPDVPTASGKLLMCRSIIATDYIARLFPKWPRPTPMAGAEEL
jgi:hypothetical protein